MLWLNKRKLRKCVEEVNNDIEFDEFERTQNIKENERAKEIGREIKRYRDRFPIGSTAKVLDTLVIIERIEGSWPQDQVNAMVVFFNKKGGYERERFPVESLVKK